MLINCVAYREGRKLADVPVERIGEYLQMPDCVLWVALLEPDENEMKVMRAQFKLPSLAVEDAGRGHQRPKLEEYGEMLFVVLQILEIGGPTQDLVAGEVDIFVGRNYVLSVRHNAQQGFTGIRERCEREPELLRHGPAFILYALMDAVVDRYFPVVDALEEELERIEERIFSKAGTARMNLEEVYALKRKLMVLLHATVALEEAVGKLHGGRVPQLCQTLQDYFRDVSDHLIRVERSVESIREMTTTAIQVNLSLISLSESEVTKKLASYGALFAVPTAIAGIYGMNFKFMPELEWSWGYPAVLILIVLFEVLLWRRFRKTGWC